MLTSRAGTVVVVVGWLSSWGLVWVHGAFLILIWAALGAMIIGILASGGCPCKNCRSGISYTTFIPFPIKKKSERHNERARLYRRIAALDEGKRACQELIETATEEEATRIPVLEAERDAAEREIERLQEDIRRLEAGWEREDRERKYKELVG